MTTLATGRRGVVEIVEDVAKSDEGTAQLMVEMLTYDALCDEVDRVRPFLERDGRAFIAKRLQGALEHIAKRYPTADEAERAELEEMAESLCLMVPVSKEGDGEGGQPDQRWWEDEQRDRFGRWTKGTVDALRLFAGHKYDKDKQLADEAHSQMQSIARGNRYDRARALGMGLQSTKNPHAQAVGTLARMVGDIGPEAEKVFGRGLTRLAYRYRGTERRPNPQYNAATQGMVRAALARNKDSDNPIPPDQVRLRTVADAGAGFLYPSVPNQKLAEISLKAGKMPPSQGLLFDADGRPVSQSVGFNGDHYLPFDLKNLKRLRGGQYVRTRTTGGLTDEDIYTGLLTGARQITVVSNSGVFSIEFDPALRGGRRYSDKARQMVDRYAALLSTINQGEKNDLMVNDLTPREKAALRQQATERAKGHKDLADQYYRDDLEKERYRRRSQTLDDEELMDEARAEARQQMAQQQRAGEVRGVSSRTLAQRTRDIFQAKKEQQRAQMVRYYRLDFDGYRAAQDALAQEFPYFIRSKSAIPLDEWLRRSGRLRPDDELPPRPGVDMGYARQGSLHQGERPSRPSAPEVGEDRRQGERREEAPTAPRRPEAAAAPTAAETAAWHDALADPARRAELEHSLERSLAYRSLITNMQPPISMSDNDEEALANGPDAYAAWLLHSKRSPRGVAEFLLNPETNEEHLDKVTAALDSMYDFIPDGLRAYSKADADAAKAQIEQIKTLREPYAKPTAQPVLGDATKPQPFADILRLVGDQAALNRYAEEHEDVARQARSYLGDDQKAKDGINTDLRQVRLVEGWKKLDNGLVDPASTPTGAKITADDANLYLRDRDNSELWQSLERKQKGWALARAAELTGAINHTEVQVGPKEEVAHRAPSSASRSLPVRKRQAGFGKRSASPHPSSSSSLAVVLAKRLAEDPRYLGRLLSDLDR